MFGSFTYRHNPVWAQELLISARSSLRGVMREGRAFDAVAAELQESQWWSERELLDFQSRGQDKWRIIHAWLLDAERLSDDWISIAPRIVP